MTCPKCGKDHVSFRYEEPVAVEVDSDDLLDMYYHAECNDCGWKGYGTQSFDLSGTVYEYNDNAELPVKSEKVAYFGKSRKEVGK